jgi:tetratricopeptide (TPR) repeat protein
VTARLHLFVAQAEAKRGLVDNARRHTSMARRILKTSSNVYLSAFTANQDLALAVIRSEFDAARECGQRAIELAEQSGVAKLRKAVFGNLGNLYVELGEFDRARKYFESALSIPPVNGSNTTAILESLARVHLLQDRVDSCLSSGSNRVLDTCRPRSVVIRATLFGAYSNSPVGAPRAH